jgi:hypothetical protein
MSFARANYFCQVCTKFIDSLLGDGDVASKTAEHLRVLQSVIWHMARGKVFARLRSNTVLVPPGAEVIKFRLDEGDKYPVK